MVWLNEAVQCTWSSWVVQIVDRIKKWCSRNILFANYLNLKRIWIKEKHKWHTSLIKHAMNWRKNINIEFFGSEQNEWKNVWLSLIHVLLELLQKIINNNKKSRIWLNIYNVNKMALLGTCFCCSLLTAAILAGMISTFLYSVAFALEIWSIIEVKGRI